MWDIFSYAYLLPAYPGEVSELRFPILIGCLVFCCWILQMDGIFWLDVLHKYFLLVYSLSFHSLTVSFAERKFLTLTKYNLVIFTPWVILLVFYLKKHHQTQDQREIFLLFSQKFYSFAFHSYVIFRVHLIKVLQSMSKVICSSNICWKGYLISIELSLHLCQRSVDYIFVNLRLGSVFSSLMYVSFLLSVLCNLDLPGHRPWPRTRGGSSRQLPLTSDAGRLLSAIPALS